MQKKSCDTVYFRFSDRCVLGSFWGFLHSRPNSSVRLMVKKMPKSLFWCQNKDIYLSPSVEVRLNVRKGLTV